MNRCPRRSLLLSLIALAFLGTPARAQGGYYNLDGGRPTRLEDALPTPRYELELELAPARYEALPGGVRRWRLEPKVTYGIAPFTDVEIRAPYIIGDSPDEDAPLRTGVAGVAVGALHAFGVERSVWPAVALAGEWIAPVGALAPNIGSYGIKAIATKTFAHARTHLNVLYGTYSAKVNVCALPRPINHPAPPGCPPTPIPYDPPCDVIPSPGAATALPARSLALCSAQVVEEFDPARSVGMRWMTAFGVDRAFALRSVLLSADVVAERFAGLVARTDVSAEIGARYQWTPQLVIDAGVTRHFVGLLRSNSISLGIGYGVATPFRRTR